MTVSLRTAQQALFIATTVSLNQTIHPILPTLWEGISFPSLGLWISLLILTIALMMTFFTLPSWTKSPFSKHIFYDDIRLKIIDPNGQMVQIPSLRPLVLIPILVALIVISAIVSEGFRGMLDISSLALCKVLGDLTTLLVAWPLFRKHEDRRIQRRVTQPAFG